MKQYKKTQLQKTDHKKYTIITSIKNCNKTTSNFVTETFSGPRMRPIFGGLRLETNPNLKTNEREMQIKYKDIATNQTAVHVNTLEQYSNN